MKKKKNGRTTRKKRMDTYHDLTGDGIPVADDDGRIVEATAVGIYARKERGYLRQIVLHVCRRRVDKVGLIKQPVQRLLRKARFTLTCDDTVVFSKVGVDHAHEIVDLAPLVL